MARIGTEEGQIEYCDRLVCRLLDVVNSQDIHAEVEQLIEDVREDGQAALHELIWDAAFTVEERDGDASHITVAVKGCPLCVEQGIGKKER